MSNALAVHGIVKRFGNHVAVDDISFEVPRGVVYGILGPNGAGKSTTLRMVNDIFAPDAGEIIVLDGLRPGHAAARRFDSAADSPRSSPTNWIISATFIFGYRPRSSGR